MQHWDMGDDQVVLRVVIGTGTSHFQLGNLTLCGKVPYTMVPGYGTERRFCVICLKSRHNHTST